MLRAVRTVLIILLNIIFYGLVLFGCVQIVHSGYSFTYDVFGDTMAEQAPGKDCLFTLENGQTEYEVATALSEQNLVKNRYSFYLRMQLEKRAESSLQPGTYTLNTSMTYEEILNEILGQHGG